jgi:hypothetical protein
LLHQGAIGVEQGNDVFTVSLPLIKSLNYESTDHRR